MAISVDQFNAALQSDPQYQQMLSAVLAKNGQKDPGQVFNSRPLSNIGNYAPLAQYVAQKKQQLGFEVPNGYSFGPSGLIEQAAPFDWGRALLAVAPIAAGLGLAAAGVGGGFAGAGGGAASGSAPTLEGISAGGSGATSIPSAATSVLPDAGASIVPASAGSQAAAEGAAGSGGILGTAGKVLGFNTSDPNSYLKLAGAVGGALGAAGQGAAQGRLTQTELNQRQDALAQQQYQNQLTAPGKIAGNSVRGDILSNAQNFSYGAPTMVGNIPVPTSSGGLRPSIFSDNTRQLGARQSADALAMPGPPALTPMDTAGTGSSILNAAGAIGSFADLLNPNNYTSKIPYKRPVQGQVA